MVNNQSGFILVWVLCMILLLSFICTEMLSSIWLQTKQLSAVKIILETIKEVEEVIVKAESHLINVNGCTDKDDAQWIGFVPDTLSFAPTHGVDFYRLEKSHPDKARTIITTWGIRSH